MSNKKLSERFIEKYSYYNELEQSVIRMKRVYILMEIVELEAIQETLRETDYLGDWNNIYNERKSRLSEIEKEHGL